jgi:flagellar hook-basal body complex protein FliE
MATPLAAANAYASLARLTDPGRSSALGGNSGNGTSFGAVLKDALTAHISDVQSKALAAGKSNIVDVVTAVAETEVAIDAVVAVRDRVIQAYEEIMKMPI